MYPLEYSGVTIESIAVDGIEIFRINTYHDEVRAVAGVGPARGPFYTCDPGHYIDSDNADATIKTYTMQPGETFTHVILKNYGVFTTAVADQVLAQNGITDPRTLDALTAARDIELPGTWIENDFNSRYVWAFDEGFYHEACRRACLPGEEPILPMTYHEIMIDRGLVAALRDDMRLATRTVNGNKVYFETPDTIKKITIKYMIRRAFSTYAITRFVSPKQINPDDGLALNMFLALGDAGLGKIHYENGSDPYYHLAPRTQIDPGVDITKLVSLNPALTIENTGFLYIDHIDRMPASVTVRVTPDTIIGSGGTMHSDNILYWYAIVRDRNGCPVPNCPVRTRVEGVIDVTSVQGTVAGVVNNDVPHNVTYIGNNVTDFMGRVGGTLSVPLTTTNGTVKSAVPLQFSVEYLPFGEIGASRTAPVIYGSAEIYVEEV